MEDLERFVESKSNKIRGFVTNALEDTLQQVDWNTIGDLQDLYDEGVQHAISWSEITYYRGVVEILEEDPSLLNMTPQDGDCDTPLAMLQDLIREEVQQELNRAISSLIDELNDIYCRGCEEAAEVFGYKGNGEFLVVCPECETSTHTTL